MINIPPLREAEPPRKYRLPSQVNPALVATLAKLEKELARTRYNIPSTIEEFGERRKK